MKTTKLSTSTDSRQAFLAACADNRGKLLQAIKDGFSFVIRLKDEYLLFKSQSEMESLLVAAGECMGRSRSMARSPITMSAGTSDRLFVVRCRSPGPHHGPMAITSFPRQV